MLTPFTCDWQVPRDSLDGRRSQQHCQMPETHRRPRAVPHIPDPQGIKGENFNNLPQACTDLECPSVWRLSRTDYFGFAVEVLSARACTAGSYGSSRYFKLGFYSGTF